MNDLVSIFLEQIESGAEVDDAMESVRVALLDQITYLLDAAQEFSDCKMVKKMTDIQNILTNINTEM